jgi:hypothetical protein
MCEPAEAGSLRPRRGPPHVAWPRGLARSGDTPHAVPGGGGAPEDLLGEGARGGLSMENSLRVSERNSLSPRHSLSFHCLLIPLST